MISTLRALFLARLLREKLLLVAFAVILMAFWLSSFFGRAHIFFADERKSSLDLSVQARWLANRSKIEAEAEKAASEFVPGKTLDSTQLLGVVTQLANNAGLRNTSSGVPQHPVSTGKFTYNTLDFNIQKVSWTDLQTFYYALQALKPYVGIQKFVVVADPATPAMLTALFTVDSVEIKPEGE